MRKFKVLDCESVKDFALGFENEVFELAVVIDKKYLDKNPDINENCIGCYILNTYDGELIFTPEEVEEVF
ncbi:MAG: hypothetical protein ACRC1T_05720 [Clostridium chrysemydis]|uniref:hypothetical protein n=1 Tax=Clostridium chrysemydis TaxID=2665504 RepID=UPI003F2FEBD1